MRNTLGLDDDMDGVDVVQNLARVFDVKISNEEATRILTVGDFYDLLIERISTDADGQKCGSAMAFYRLRKAIRDLGYATDLVPSTDIHFLERRNLKEKFRTIEQASGLNLPSTVATTAGCIAALIAFLATPTFGYFLFPHEVSVVFGFLAGLFAGGAVLRYLDPGKLPKDCNTLAELARTTAMLSFGRLVKLGARHSPNDVWANLVEVLSPYGLPKSEITRETFFLKSQLKKGEAA